MIIGYLDPWGNDEACYYYSSSAGKATGGLQSTALNPCPQPEC